MIEKIKLHIQKFLDRIKLILMLIGIFFILRLCYIVDEPPVIMPENKKKVTVKKPSNFSNNLKITNKLTIDKTNQDLLKKQHISKYSYDNRVVEPIGMND